jgi:SNF2 family DNA or RNA helicase
VRSHGQKTAGAATRPAPGCPLIAIAAYGGMAAPSNMDLWPRDSPTRLKKILEAPRWDLIVFDEAHHLTAYQTGNKVTKTQNFKLAEALREHSRDLLLLSATPHQGDHFRFWMLIRLLNPSLFLSTDDMLHNRYRLNSVVFRRTQADACDAHGEPLFSRRQVHTQTFRLSQPESVFEVNLAAIGSQQTIPILCRQV